MHVSTISSTNFKRIVENCKALLRTQSISKPKYKVEHYFENLVFTRKKIVQSTTA